MSVLWCHGIDHEKQELASTQGMDGQAVDAYAGTREELKGKTIGEVARAEFDLYRAHLLKINGKENFGWLRNMYHGLCQQAMCQDPAYCALRPDRNVNLISYPYYAKHQVPGDQTFFRHIDINFKNLVGRGAHMIQGSLSLDDEHNDDCTMILPGMHKHFMAWEEVLAQRSITPTMWTQDDAQRFGTDWTPQPCRQGQVRVTLPHRPHGASGPAKNVRRALLP